MREAGRVRKTLVINNFPVLCDFSFYILSVILLLFLLFFFALDQKIVRCCSRLSPSSSYKCIGKL